MASKRKDLRIIIEDSNTQTPINLTNHSRNPVYQHQEYSIPHYDPELVQSKHVYTINSKLEDDLKEYHPGLSTQMNSFETKPIKVIGRSQIAIVESRLSQNIRSLDKSQSKGSQSRSLKPRVQFYQDLIQKQNIKINQMPRSISNGYIGISSSKKKIMGNILRKLNNTSQSQEYCSRSRSNYSQKNRHHHFEQIKKILKNEYHPKHRKLESNKITTKLNKLENMLKQIKQMKQTQTKAHRKNQFNSLEYQQQAAKQPAGNKKEKSRSARQKSFAKIHEQLKLVKNGLEQIKYKNQVLKKQLTHNKYKNIKYYHVSPMNQSQMQIRQDGLVRAPRYETKDDRHQAGYPTKIANMKSSPIQALSNTIGRGQIQFRQRGQDLRRINHNRK